MLALALLVCCGMGCYTPTLDLQPLPAVELPALAEVVAVDPSPLLAGDTVPYDGLLFVAEDVTRMRELVRQQARAIAVLEQQRAADRWYCEGEVSRAADALKQCRQTHAQHAVLGGIAGASAALGACAAKDSIRP
jgi:hypothetical protein